MRAVCLLLCLLVGVSAIQLQRDERRARTARSAPRYLHEKYHDVENTMNAVDRTLGTEGTEGTEADAEDVADLDVTSLDEALDTNTEAPMAEVEVEEGSRAQASVSVDNRLTAAYNKMEKGMSSGEQPSKYLDELFSLMDESHEANYAAFTEGLRADAHTMR